MPIATDIAISSSKIISWTGNATDQHTVLAFHRFIAGLADDEEASVDDIIDITSDTPSDRSTDNIISLLNGFTVTDEVMEHLFDGSISQNNGDDLWSGLVVVGTVVSGTELQINRDDKMLNPYWGTGLNPDAANNIIMRVCIKTRSGGADIDGKRLRVRAGEFGDKYAEFSLTAGLGNSTAAVFTSNDLNNANTEATVAAFTTITNTEGFQLVDITGDGADEEYYHQWNIGSQTINDTYERTKWYQMRPTAEDSNADTGSNFIVDDATIIGQGQSFSIGSHGLNKKMVRATWSLKIGGGAPSGTMTAEVYAHSGSFGSSSVPTGGALATSETIDTSRLTSTYRDYTFVFYDNVTLVAGTNYVVVIRHPNGGAADFVHVEGLASSGTHAGNRSEETGSWAATATDDLGFSVFVSPELHGRAGELHRGPTHDIDYDAQTANYAEDDILNWGTEITYDNLGGGPFTLGEYVTFQPSGGGTVKNAGKVIKDNGSTLMKVALEDTSGSILLDDDIITGIDSGATADIATTIVDDDKAGGEGILLAYDDGGATGTIYIQLLSGSAPVDDLPIDNQGSGDGLVNASIISRTISPEFVGASTGSNIIGAYGIAFEPADVGSSDQFFDLQNTLRQPPNNVTFTVDGLVSGEDRVLVGPRNAGILEKNQFTLDIALTGGAETAVDINATIPSDTPTPAGTIRIELDTGVYKRVPYTSYATDIFTIGSTSFTAPNDASIGNDVFISYIDEAADATSEAYTAVYSSDRDLFVRVRDGGASPIKTFETPATFASANTTITAIRTTDA